MKGKSNIKCICMILLAALMCVLSSCAFHDKRADDMGGYSGILPSDNLQEETVFVTEQETTDNSFSYYGTWEVKDYQSAEFSTLTGNGII